MKNSTQRFGAIFCFVSVITTLGVHLIPVNASTFDESVMLFNNSTYLFTRWWIIFHCLAVFFSMAAASITLDSQKNVNARIGFISFTVFSWAEITRMLLSLIYLNHLRELYATESDPSLKSLLKMDIQNFYFIGETLFALFILGFALGNLFYGIELIKKTGVARVTGYFLVFWASTGVLTLVNIFYPSDFAAGFFPIFNVTFQPAARLLVGIWLLKESK